MMDAIASLTQHMDTVSALLLAFAALVGAGGAAGRALLLVLDRLDDRWPSLHRISDPLGSLLGGGKPRGKHRGESP